MVSAAGLLLLPSGLIVGLQHLIPTPNNDAGKAPVVGLSTVKMPSLEALIAEHAGKVVVEYLWSDYSVPDILWLAEVAMMRHRFPAEKVVFLSVCHSPADVLDADGLAERPKWILKMLRRAKADMLNVLLDEDDDVWLNKLDYLGGGPAFRILDERGRCMKVFQLTDGPYEHSGVEMFLHRRLGREQVRP